MHTLLHGNMQVDASLLAAMFSGRWEASHIHTSAGHIFLDYSPACFQKIVNYLRLRRCNDVSGAVTARPPLTDLTPDDQHAYHDLVDYLGLTQYMGYVRVAPQPDGGMSHVSVSNDGYSYSVCTFPTSLGACALGHRLILHCTQQSYPAIQCVYIEGMVQVYFTAATHSITVATLLINPCQC